MDISSLTIRLLFLFFPGIISIIIIDHLTVHNRIDGFRYFIYSFLLGFLDYYVYHLLSKIEFLKRAEVQFFNALFNEEIAVNYDEVLWVSVIAVLVGFGLSYMIKYRIIFRFLKLIKVSDKTGTIDVWNYIFSSENTEWVTIRDFKQDLMYIGWVKAFSHITSEKDELFLKDVKVYKNSTGEPLYGVSGLYYSLKRGDMQIEFQKLEYTDIEKKIRGKKDE